MNYLKSEMEGKKQSINEFKTFPTKYSDMIDFEKKLFRAKWEHLLNNNKEVFLSAMYIINMAEKCGQFDNVKFPCVGELQPVEGVSTIF